MSEKELIVVSRSPGVWGAEISLMRILNSAPEHGFNPKVIVGKGSPLANALTLENIPFVEFEFAENKLATSIFSNMNPIELIKFGLTTLASGIRLRKYFNHADVILNFSTWQSAEVAIAALLVKRPWILDLHDTFAGKRAGPALRLVASLARGVIAPSQTLLTRYQLSNDSRDKSVPRPIYVGGAPTETDCMLAHPNRPVTVGIFGQIVEHKGVFELAETILNENSGGVRLLVVGGSEPGHSSPYEQSVREVVNRIGNGSKVFPRVDDPQELMRRCDVIANVSQHEAFGRTVVEGMNAGAIPLVLSGGGPAEIVSAAGVGHIADTFVEIPPLLNDIGRQLREQGPETVRLHMWTASLRYGDRIVLKEYFDEIKKFMKR